MSAANIIYDEACCVAAMSYLELAKAEKDPKKGIELAKNAEKYSGMGIFAKRDVRASAVLLISSLAEKL